jgi:hypothetical protein
VVFINNAGITNRSGASILFDGQSRLTTGGTGVLMNSGLVEKTGTTATLTHCGLPLINNAPAAELLLNHNLEFNNKGQQTNASVQQNNGSVILENGATLEADFGYAQNSGYLETYGAATTYVNTVLSQVNVDVVIHGRIVMIGVDTYSTLETNGKLTMDGGVWKESVDGTTFQADLFRADDGFAIGAGASLYVTTYNIRTGGEPPKIKIMDPGLGAFSGDFGSKSLYPWSSSSNDPTIKLYYLYA